MKFDLKALKLGLLNFWAEIYTPSVQRFTRIFFVNAIAAFSVDKFFLEPDSDLRLSMFKAAVAAGLAAVFKYWRDNSENDSLIQKIPL